MKSRIQSAMGAAALMVNFATPAFSQDTGQVITDSGPVIGVTQGAAAVYLGIPYAAPPTGALRWRPPKAVASWVNPLHAENFGPQCPQNADLGVFARAGGAEDCLTLNIYSKATAASQGKRPVMVWIHGGGYSVGGGSDHDGSKLAIDGDTVVVTINYRLGALGFLSHPALDAEGHAFGNYGLMDQQFALDWVHRNIAAFGGDPQNVTIFGESSGGTSVMSQIVSPGAAGLFQHAISMSGSAIILKHPNFGAPRPLDVATALGTGFAKAAGCVDQSAACLRALPVDKILSTQTPFIVNQAIIDGTVLPMTYAKAFAQGKVNKVTLINGSNLDEWRWAAGFIENATNKPMTEAGYPAAIESYYGKPLAAAVVTEYPPRNYITPTEAWSAAITDSLFACTGRKTNKWLSAQMPVYAYEFADRTAPSYLKPTTFTLGAGHTLELAYIFPGYHGGAGLPIALNPLQEKLSDQMVAFFAGANSAQTGPWPLYNPAQENVMTFVLPEARMISSRFAKQHHCAFWDKSGIY